MATAAVTHSTLALEICMSWMYIQIVERSDNVQMYILLGVQILDVEHTSVHCSINIMYIHLFFLLMTRELYRHVVLCTTHVVCANLKEREAEEVVILMWILCSDLL